MILLNREFRTLCASICPTVPSELWLRREKSGYLTLCTECGKPIFTLFNVELPRSRLTIAERTSIIEDVLTPMLKADGKYLREYYDLVANNPMPQISEEWRKFCEDFHATTVESAKDIAVYTEGLKVVSVAVSTTYRGDTRYNPSDTAVLKKGGRKLEWTSRINHGMNDGTFESAHAFFEGTIKPFRSTVDKHLLGVLQEAMKWAERRHELDQRFSNHCK